MNTTELDQHLGQDLTSNELPGAKTALVLGIIAATSVMASCCCSLFIVVVLPCGIVAWIMGRKAVRMFDNNPGAFPPSERSQAQWGLVLGIISTSLCGISILVLIASLLFSFGIPLLEQFQYQF